ncbi:hypothetical protein [Desulfosporosinus sp. HMP52]|nr:hypothetical protein [Desulfosporosinus sp. HMP52]
MTEYKSGAKTHKTIADTFQELLIVLVQLARLGVNLARPDLCMLNLV